MNDVLGAVIEGTMLWQHQNPKEDHTAAEGLVDDCIDTFDDLIVRVNDRSVQDRKQNLKKVRADFEDKAQELVIRLNGL